jgi:hypothetical protein
VPLQVRSKGLQLYRASPTIEIAFYMRIFIGVLDRCVSFLVPLREQSQKTYAVGSEIHGKGLGRWSEKRS